MSDDDVNPMGDRDLSEDDRLAPRVHPRHREGALTRVIEQKTAVIPSGVFLAASGVAIAVSLGLELTGHHRKSQFIGLWPAFLLSMGIYNKIVKSLGPA